MSDQKLLFVAVGDNSARAFGMSARERARRLATNAGFEWSDEPARGRPTVLADLAFAWDPAWLKAIGGRPSTALALDGRPVLVHANAEDAIAAAEAVASGKVPKGF